MLHRLTRTELLIGKNNLDKLASSKVAVFGVGGVGSFAVEALARSGVGNIVLIDNDVVCITNINRQLIALESTIGKSKVEIMKERILQINPEATVTIYQEFYLPGLAEKLIKDDYNYIIDAIDTVTGKLDLIENANKLNIPIISAMGAGNKLDPTKFEVADIYNTSICPLAKVMRKELRKREIKSLKVVYSRELPIKPLENEDADCTNKNPTPGSISFVPSVMGLIIAGEVVKEISGIDV